MTSGRAGEGRWLAHFGLGILVVASLAGMCLAQSPPVAILVDGDGPWRDSNWTIASSEFSRLLSDAGYVVTTVSPVDVSSALNMPGIMLAVPSLERLPFSAFTAVAQFLAAGGSLMATGGEPFRDPLYLTPGGAWLDAPGSFTPPIVETLSPWYKQYVPDSWPSSIRVPVARPRGLSAMGANGRYRVIGDLLAPSATLYAAHSGSLIVWLPWPQLFDPDRGQLVAALHAARNRLYLLNAGAQQIVTLPGEHVALGAGILNAGGSAAQALLQWSISGPAGLVFQSSIAVSLAPGILSQAPAIDAGVMTNGDYTVSARLTIGDEEIDRIDSAFRVFDPTTTRQPDQAIHVVNGSFYVGSRRIFLRGVNYWPRYIAGLEPDMLAQDWLMPQNYDPEAIEADLSLIASLNFNLVEIRYGQDDPSGTVSGRTLADFLERCRNHGIWVRISIPATDGNGAYPEDVNSAIGSLLTAAFLPGNERVFAYDLLWEPLVGSHSQGGDTCRNVNLAGLVCNAGRSVLDPDWRTWVNDQYGSLANAQQAWGFNAPLDKNGQLTNPLDEQIENDGPWRVMVAAFRRFADDFFGRNLGVIARAIRHTDPNALLSYRNGPTMTETHNDQTGYDIGTGAAHLDFFSPENYDGSLTWPDDRKWGLVTVYSRYRTGGKPVQWTEFGVSIGPNEGTAASRTVEAGFCDAMMRQVNDDGSSAATVWWWPGGWKVQEQSDYGIIDPDGTPRDCASIMAQWATAFATAPPDQGSGSPATLSVDRDADARGEYGLSLAWQNSYVQARQAGQPVVLADQGTGTDTSTMPLIQAGDIPYTGSGPIKFANAELGGIHIVCSSLDATVENNTRVIVPFGDTCQITPTLVNTGEAQWLPATAPKGGVVLHTSFGDAPLTAPVPSLQRIALGPLAFTQSQPTLNITGRLRVQSVGEFGETLRLTLAADTAGACAVSLSSAAPIAAPAAGMNGIINVATGAGCPWITQSPQPWVSVTPGSGTGSGAVNYFIQANPGPARETTITIAGHPVTVTQAGAVNPPLVAAPTLSTSTLTFGSQMIGSSSAAQTVSLANTAASPLNLSSIAIGGAGMADFTEKNTCGSTLAARDSCQISIVFMPVAAGTRSASLFIMGNVGGGPMTVSLSGAGVGKGPVPSIKAITDVWNYTFGVAPGNWVSIFGTDLSVGPPNQLIYPATGLLPTIANATSVTFNGIPAALLYVSTTQINTLVPAGIAAGPLQVVVQSNGVTSAPFTMVATATQPAIYAVPNSGSLFVTACLQGTGYMVGDPAEDPRVVRPAFPGDVLDLYMVGMGATIDPKKFITDQSFEGAYPLSAPVTAMVGNEDAPVLFAGLTSPGLYMVRVAIPTDLPAGLQPIQVTAGAGKTSPTLALMVGIARPNLIQQGSFESVLGGIWNFDVHGEQGAAGAIQRTTSTDVDGGYSTQIGVTSAVANAANSGAVQLWQAGFPLQQGRIYRLQFWAKSDRARTLWFETVQNGGDSQNDGLRGAAILGGDWRHFVVYFQATTSDPASRINFDFGDEAGNSWLDGVVLQ